MEYVRLGTTGTKVSRLCLGTMAFGSTQEWMLKEQDRLPVFKKAYESGINFFDTANVYSLGETEQILGKLLKEVGANRDEMVIATKVYMPMGQRPNQSGLSRKHIFASIDASLKRLGMEYVDLFQIHRFDYETPIEETLSALTDVVRAGKARYIGGSAMFSWQLAKYLYLADRHGLVRFVTMQNFYNLAYREEEREMIPLCMEEGVGLIPFSPLAGGFLVGNRETGTPRAKMLAHLPYLKRPEDQAVTQALREVASKRSESPAAVAIAWMLSKPWITAPIIGFSKLAHLDPPLKALSLKLEPEEIAVLEAPYVTQPPIGPLRRGETLPIPPGRRAN